jgi:hypothetical protein
MDYKQAIIAFLDGKPVETRCKKWPDSQDWQLLKNQRVEAMGTLLLGVWDSDFEFRIKPNTIRIGNREVDAPVLEPTERQELWRWDSEQWCPCRSVGGDADWARAGLYFATEEACQAAHDAITALLRGESQEEPKQ